MAEGEKHTERTLPFSGNLPPNIKTCLAGVFVASCQPYIDYTLLLNLDFLPFHVS